MLGATAVQPNWVYRHIVGGQLPRLTPGKERDDDSDSKFWWFNVKLDVSVTLRSNLKTTTVRYACTPREGDWDCRRQHESEAPSECRDRSFQLVRGSFWIVSISSLQTSNSR